MQVPKYSKKGSLGSLDSSGQGTLAPARPSRPLTIRLALAGVAVGKLQELTRKRYFFFSHYYYVCISASVLGIGSPPVLISFTTAYSSCCTPCSPHTARASELNNRVGSPAMAVNSTVFIQNSPTNPRSRVFLIVQSHRTSTPSTPSRQTGDNDTNRVVALTLRQAPRAKS